MGRAKRCLIGQRFGRLVVEYETNPIAPKGGKPRVAWMCKCDCGNSAIVRSIDLLQGSTKSCGCLRKETSVAVNKKYNTYDLTGSFGIGYTLKSEQFFFDKEDYEIIKNYCWRLRKDGYLDAKSLDKTNKRILMHNLIMKSKYVDHVNGKGNDNRKSNLRKAAELYHFNTYNQMNKKIQSNNTSGHTGVVFAKDKSKWVAQIGVGCKRIYLGAFDYIDDAIKARKAAEEKYFGDWAYRKCQGG